MLSEHNSIVEIPSSFRDPDGHVFVKNSVLYRTVADSYKENYSHLIQSGLYSKLTTKKFLVEHEETEVFSELQDCYKLLKPSRVKFISYPYEWSFGQLKDAALLVLGIQGLALENKMSLKDSSAFNIQFEKGKPILIDTLSFEMYKEGEPWAAYKQFCQHFLAPLALMSYKDPRLNELFKSHLDGIPLDLAASLLPVKSRFKTGIAMHIHLHAMGQKYFSNKKINRNSRQKKFRLTAFKGLIESLKTTIEKLNSPKDPGSWQHYYNDLELPSQYIEEKLKVVDKYCADVNPNFVWDLGANTGSFSNLTSLKNSFVVSLDNSHGCINELYSECRKNNKITILPLVIDIMNPSPALGWENKEWDGIFSRGNADLVMALALVHHLAITNNLPLKRIANFFRSLAKNLIIEFVPKQDINSQKLFNSKADIFPDYTIEKFEQEFSDLFTIAEKTKLAGTERVLYLMKAKAN